MLILLQNDLPKAIEFYKNLGLPLKFQLKDQWAEMMLGDVKIGLSPISQELPDRRPGIVLSVDDLPAFYQKHKDTVTFMSEPVEKLHGIMVSIKDPGNNILDLYQPTPEKLQDLVKRVKGEGDCCQGTLDDCACKSTQVPKA
jgi:hypothetical protein